VHFLHNGPPRIRAELEAFIRALDRGEPVLQAWRETLGKVPKREIEQRFYDYVNADRWTGTELPLSRVAPAPIEWIRVLRDDEVHLLWARLADSTLPVTDPRSSEAQVAEAERAAPGSAEASYVRGSLALRQSHEVEAAKHFEAALAVAPDEPRYLFAALTSFAEERRWHAPGRIDKEKAEAWMARLATTARSADELSMVARLLADQGKDQEASRAADAAIAADRSDYGAFASRAFVHFRASRFAEAIADQEHAVAIATEGADAGGLARVLESYRQMRRTLAPETLAPPPEAGLPASVAPQLGHGGRKDGR
jgi:tetratricopeptide (TPR) repeat protein